MSLYKHIYSTFLRIFVSETFPCNAAFLVCSMVYVTLDKWPSQVRFLSDNTSMILSLLYCLFIFCAQNYNCHLFFMRSVVSCLFLIEGMFLLIPKFYYIASCFHLTHNTGQDYQDHPFDRDVSSHVMY